MSEITNSQDVIDSRDIIARIDELETDEGILQDAIIEAEEALESSEGAKVEMQAGRELTEAREVLVDFNEEELNSLKALAEECENYADWENGETLINEMYFTEYCMELLKDIGDLPQDIPAYIAIDEEQTAENLKVDYMEVDFDGETYLMRSS